jgi:septal ring factor EnvC (AmiA/AmiB activator)
MSERDRAQRLKYPGSEAGALDETSRCALSLAPWQRLLFSRVTSAGVLLSVSVIGSGGFFDQELVRKLSDEASYQESVKKELARKQEELNDQRRILADMQDSVRKQAEKKRQLLASLRQEKEGRVRALRELEQAALRLQKMMDEMSRRAVRQPRELPAGSGLGAMKGKLEWPVRGEVTAVGKTRHREFSAEVFEKD